MVIKQQKYVKDGDEVLDVGCGSGILSVVALKYGAKHAFGTDLDLMQLLHQRKMQSRTI